MGRYFGTDGFRGEANVTLTAEHAFAVGRFLGWYLAGKCRERRPRVVIAKDTRRSGDMLESALSAGLTASSADAWLLHVATTPAVSFAVRQEGFDAGVMISASHNPYFDNGIKLLDGNGGKLDDDVTARLEAYLDGKEVLPLACRGEIGRVVEDSVVLRRYVEYLTEIGRRDYGDLKVGLDCANGAAGEAARAVFDALGIRTWVIHNAPDGENINESCGSTHLDDLRRLVLEQKLDVGFAYDGDGDRCLCVDERGNTVTGDHILYLCGKYMKQRGELPGNRVVATVMSNLGLGRSLEKLGIQLACTAVGDRFVCEYMADHGCALGGEQSGHIVFWEHAVTGDGILTSLKVLEAMLADGRPLSRLRDELRIYPQVQEHIPVRDQGHVLENRIFRDALEGAKARMGDRGRILVRPSGTEPLIRVMAEGPDWQNCRETVDILADVIREIG